MTIPPPGARGRRRELTVSAPELERLIEQARTQGAEVERHRMAMLEAAQRRCVAIGQLHDGGLSIAQIAAALDVSRSTIQGALGRR